MTLLPLVLALEWASAAIPVEQAGRCPGPLAIARAQQRLEAGTRQISWVAQVRELPGGALAVRVLERTGRSLVERELPASPSCEVRAQAVAVLLASWEAKLESVVDAPVVVTPALPVTGPRTEGGTLVAPPLSISADLSAGASAGTGGAVPAAELGARIGRGGAAWGARLGASLAGSRTVGLALGQVRIDEHFISLGPSWRVTSHRWRLELGGAGLLSWLRVRSEGFSHDGAASAVRPGLLTSARLARRLGPLWLGGTLALQAWPSRARVRIEGIDQAVAFAPVQGLLALQLGWDVR